MEDGGVKMFINYEHNNHVYNVTVERRENQFFITYDNNEYTVIATEQKPGQLFIQLGDRVIKSVISQGDEDKFVFIDGSIYKVKRIELTGRKKTEKREGDLHSPISGTVVSCKVKEGSPVKKDDVILIIEAMKMENEIFCQNAGIIRSVYVKAGQAVENDQVLIEIDPEMP